MKRRWPKMASAAGLAVAVVACNGIAPARAATTKTVCGPSAGAQLCLTVPALPMTGEQVVSATWAGTGSRTLEFTLNGQYLNYEYLSPASFVWPTQKAMDGTYTLSVRVHKGTTYGETVSTTVDLANGNLTSIPRSPEDYQALFAPQAGSTIAALGNGGAEKPAEVNLISYIQSTQPAAFLYLGEVHEYGTWATRRDHYGLASFDDPAGVGSLYGRMARYTLATAGNHERTYQTEFRDYWHQRPMWSTTVVAGIRIYDLTSECKTNGGCSATAPQQRWLKEQLSINSEPCVVAMWHRPLVSMDTKRSGPTMAAAWSILANAGGDLVLNADTRDMEELLPMNAALEAGQPDSHMVELISGAAAARWVTSVPNGDPRVAWRLYKTPGAVFVARQENQLRWQFRDSSGSVLRTGEVTC